MPMYAYRCDKCGHEEEHIQRFSDDPISKCESCKGPTKRIITGTAFALKGGGWYADGYASTGKSDSGGSSKSSDKGSGKASGE